MKNSFNSKNIVNSFNMKKRLLSIITLVNLTSGIVMIGGCTREEIDVANNFANEKNQNLGQEIQELDVVVDPVVEPEEEPEIESEVEPVEEVNPRDYKAVYGLDFDVPIYTEEEVEEARENLLNNYIVLDPDEGLTDEQRIAMGKDYYIANQVTIYQLYDKIRDFDIKKCQNSFKDDQPEAIYYDEDNDLYIILNLSEEKVSIHGKNFIMYKYLRVSKNFTIGNPSEVNPGVVSVAPGVQIHTSAVFSDYCYDEISEKYLNNDGNRDYAELKDFGYKESLIENPIITNYDNEQQLSQ